MRLRSVAAGALVALVMLHPPQALAVERPLWEWGGGPSLVSFSDYPGSVRSRTYLLPLPYVRYRGTFLRADRDGLHTRLFDSSAVSLNLSFGASVPVRSQDDPARAGMPNLSALLEVGPVLTAHLWADPSRRWTLDLRVPARLAVTVSATPGSVGGYLAPHLNLDVRRLAGNPGWNLGMLVGPLLASSSYNQYFYSVPPAFASTARAAYAARAGYAGFEFTVAVSRRLPHWWVGAFIRSLDLHGTAFDDSPLLKRRWELAGGLGIAWVFGHSKRTVDAEE